MTDPSRLDILATVGLEEDRVHRDAVKRSMMRAAL